MRGRDPDGPPPPPGKPAPRLALALATSPSQLPAALTSPAPVPAAQAPGEPRAGPAEPRDAPSQEPARKVSVRPQDVFQPGAAPLQRWREHSFFAPILLVVLISAALVYGGLVAAGVVWRLLR